ncbi:CoA transferase [Arthrobacter sp. RAF14]|uniref:CoA transferase n=1 Tax=Arthrobacter sp. RAF14 TaxID=3233051 RepID=UPI003F93D654
MDTMSLIRRHVETLGLDPGLLNGLRVTGPVTVLPSAFHVTVLATASVAAANLGVAAVLRAAQASGTATAAPPAVAVDSTQACAAFLSEALFLPEGWEVPSPWDALSGVYRSRDGWIRLHTNYAHHRSAALTALGLPADATRDEAAQRVLNREAAELESAVLRAGGAAAQLHSREAWQAHPAGLATAGEPAVRILRGTERTRWTPTAGTRLLAGLRVLDLTRVIAGPLATRFLAAHGAEVLRIDPPGFEEIPALLPITTQGKRRAFLDLGTRAGKERFLDLVSGADVLVHGLRPGALESLGLDGETLREAAPWLVTARLDAYGWQGPWAGRRGFDSLVQMSCGIADDGARASGTDPAEGTPEAQPRPLPAQALDHSTGHHLAAGVLSLLEYGRAGTVTASLIGAANLLYSLGTAREHEPAPSPRELAETLGAFRSPVSTAWGPAQAVPVPGSVEGAEAEFRMEAGPLGVDQPVWP